MDAAGVGGSLARFGLLGSLEVQNEDGERLDLGGPQPRLLLGLLLLGGGRAVPVDTLVDALWGDSPPASALASLHSIVSRLRQRLPGQAVIAFDDAGYRLEVDARAVDFRRFEVLAEEGQRLLDAGRFEESVAVLVEAEGLWRGNALAELAELDIARGPATRLEERRVTAVENRLAAELALGRHAAVAGELADLITAHPFREGLRQQLALALYRSGRQAEALRVLADAGRVLREELGIEPSRPLRELETAILNHDSTLDVTTVVSPTIKGDGELPASSGLALVGRDGELALLLAAFDGARTDSGFVVIEGEPGIGKSRLAEELRVVTAANGAVAVWGRADESGAAPALWPWLAALRVLIDRIADPPAELAELLSGEIGFAPGPATALQFERFESVARLLERAGAGVPVVVLLDDLQWADVTSLDLLAHLAQRPGRGVLVVGTMRPLEVGRVDALTDTLATISRRPHSRRLLLRGLDEGATGELLAGVSTRAVASDVVRAIHARAEGNPFYAIELARLRDDEGLLDEVPGSVSDVVRRRVNSLPGPTVDLLGVAAVIGRDVDLDLLARSADLDASSTLDRLEPAVAHRLLVEIPERPTAVRFNHALVREVLRDGLTSLRRARLHLRVADAIEAAGAGVDDAEILAEHLYRAAPVGVAKRAAQALERAAEVAVRRVAYQPAEDLLTKAVRLRRATGGSTDDRHAELVALLRLLEVIRALRYYQGADPELIGRAKELVETVAADELLPSVLFFEWSGYATAARVEEAAPLAAQLLALTADDRRAGVRASGHEVYAVSCWGAGRITEACEHLDRALVLLDGAPPPADVLEVEQRMAGRLFWLLCHALHGDHSWDDVLSQYRELATATSDRFIRKEVCGFAGSLATVVQRFDDLEEFCSIADSADPNGQFTFWTGQVTMFRGILRARQGDASGGITTFDDGRRAYLAVGGHSGLPSFEAVMATTVATAGETVEAESLIRAARVGLERTAEHWNEPTVLLGEAAVARARGNLRYAAERRQAAIDTATAQGAYGLAHLAAQSP